MSVNANWKKDPVQDHFLDNINVKRFHSSSIINRLRYTYPFLMTISTLLVYTSDIWTALNLLINHKTALNSYFGIHSKDWFPYVFYFSISTSILLALWEIRRAWRILYSRDVAFIYTDPIANRFHVILSYCNFCFFDKIAEARSIMDQMAFFVYFRLKSWKRLFFVQVPREAIKCYVIILFVRSLKTDLSNFRELSVSFSPNQYVSYITIGSLVVTHLMFLYAWSLTIVAGIFYIPLAIQIQGNLKEYCCYRIDKRVSQLLIPRTSNIKKKRMKPSQLSEASTVIVVTTPELVHSDSPPRKKFPSLDASSLWSQDTVKGLPPPV